MTNEHDQQEGWEFRGYVTIPNDPSNSVYALQGNKEFPAARALVNRSLPLECEIRALRESARPIEEFGDFVDVLGIANNNKETTE